MRKLILGLALALAAVVSVPGSAKTDEASPDVLPLKPGSYWLYQGTAKWTKPGGEVTQKDLTWKMQVIDVVHRNPVTAALVKGHPEDLVWYEEGRAPGDYVILSLGGKKFYLVAGERAGEVLARVKDPDDALVDLVSEDELFLEAPLYPSQTFGMTEQLARDDLWYVWVVEGEGPADLSMLKGAVSQISQRQYHLTLRSNPEDTAVDFVPGVGITRFQYNHHGTVAETDLKLVEFSSG